MRIPNLVGLRTLSGGLVSIAMLGLVACGGDEHGDAAGSLLDKTFGTNGKVTTSIGGINIAAGVATVSDGKILLAGYSSFFSTSYDFTLGRFNNDGSLDLTFGTNGKVSTDIGGYADRASGMAIQGDGKIVVVGISYGNNYTSPVIAVVRYNADGSLDSTFGTNGKVTTAIGTSASASAVALQDDGKIVVVGSSSNGSGSEFAVVRYNTNGSLDSTFGSGGKVTTAIGTQDSISAVAIQGDGKIVVVGSATFHNYFALARYNADGSLDSTFGTDGKVTTAMGTIRFESANAVAIQNDGKLLVAGAASGGMRSYFVLARYNADGSLDATFSSDGKVTTSIGGDSYASAMAVQSDGKIVLAGSALVNYTEDFAVARYYANGSLDTTFQVAGVATTDIGRDDLARAMAIQSDGKIVLVGDTSGSSIPSDFVLVRYLP